MSNVFLCLLEWQALLCRSCGYCLWPGRDAWLRHLRQAPHRSNNLSYTAATVLLSSTRPSTLDNSKNSCSGLTNIKYSSCQPLVTIPLRHNQRQIEVQELVSFTLETATGSRRAKYCIKTLPHGWIAALRDKIRATSCYSFSFLLSTTLWKSQVRIWAACERGVLADHSPHHQEDLGNPRQYTCLCIQ